MDFSSELIVALLVECRTNVAPLPIDDHFKQGNRDRGKVDEGSEEGRDSALVYCNFLGF